MELFYYASFFNFPKSLRQHTTVSTHYNPTRYVLMRVKGWLNITFMTEQEFESGFPMVLAHSHCSLGNDLSLLAASFNMPALLAGDPRKEFGCAARFASGHCRSGATCSLKQITPPLLLSHHCHCLMNEKVSPCLLLKKVLGVF